MHCWPNVAVMMLPSGNGIVSFKEDAHPNQLNSTHSPCLTQSVYVAKET